MVFVDAKFFREHCVLIALGVDSQGTKHVLGLREGSTENAAVARALLADLVERGLPTERSVLFAIDGAKALRRAIAEVYGERAAVQRCQVHKRRNVLAHLPEHQHAQSRGVCTRPSRVNRRGSGNGVFTNLGPFALNATIPERLPRCVRGSTRPSPSFAWA